MWKFRELNKLPAHLCACALLGKVAHSAAFTHGGQSEAESPSLQQNLTYTGRQIEQNMSYSFPSTYFFLLFLFRDYMMYFLFDRL